MPLNCGAGKDSWESFGQQWERSNQSIVREINPEFSLEGLMLKLQYVGHLMQTANSLKKSLMLGKIEDRRRRGCQRIRWLDDITDAMDMNLGKLREMVRDREAWLATVHGSQRSDPTVRLNSCPACSYSLYHQVGVTAQRDWKGWAHTRASPEPISLWTMPIKSGIVLIFFRHH